jgi:hypothetical protein
VADLHGQGEGQDEVDQREGALTIPVSGEDRSTAEY